MAGSSVGLLAVGWFDIFIEVIPLGRSDRFGGLASVDSGLVGSDGSAPRPGAASPEFATRPTPNVFQETVGEQIGLRDLLETGEYQQEEGTPELGRIGFPQRRTQGDLDEMLRPTIGLQAGRPLGIQLHLKPALAQGAKETDRRHRPRGGTIGSRGRSRLSRIEAGVRIDD